MPERFLLQFMTEDASWMDEAICLRRRFERVEDGRYLCSEFQPAHGALPAGHDVAGAERR